jgi:hypothetical protein
MLANGDTINRAMAPVAAEIIPDAHRVKAIYSQYKMA